MGLPRSSYNSRRTSFRCMALIFGLSDVRRQLRRSEVLPFFEAACVPLPAWKPALPRTTARAIAKFGHEVQLMSARYVKPYVTRTRTMTRPTMRFVKVKTEGQQSVIMLDRTRHLSVAPLLRMYRARFEELSALVLAAGSLSANPAIGRRPFG
jgi:hypothetical protein